MSLPYPEENTVWPDLTPDENNQVQAVANAPLQSKAQAAAALGGAFLVYRMFMQHRLRQRLKDVEDLPPEQLSSTVSDVFSSFVPAWTHMVVPAVFSSLLMGVEETTFPIENKTIQGMAYLYSWNLGQYLNKRALDSAKRGYQAQLNRKIDRRQAKKNIIEAFGTTIPGIRSLVNIWSEDEPAGTAEHKVTSTKAARARRIINTDINTRAKKVGEEETFSLRSMGKQAAWTLAQHKGLVPMNATRKWVTAKDEKVCPVCGPLHNTEVSISEPFRVGKQKFWHPPLHPNCRCEVKLKANLSQEVGYRLHNMLFSTKGWTSADDSVAKSDNDWETQPRSASGQFGSRPKTATATRDLLSEAKVADDTPDLQGMVNNALTNQLDHPHQTRSLYDAKVREHPSLFRGESESLYQSSLYGGTSLFTRSLYEPTASLFSAEQPSLFEKPKSVYGQPTSLYRKSRSLFEGDEAEDDDYVAEVPRQRLRSERLFSVFNPYHYSQDLYVTKGQNRLTTREMYVTTNMDEIAEMVDEQKVEVRQNWLQDYRGSAVLRKHTHPKYLNNTFMIPAEELGPGKFFVLTGKHIMQATNGAEEMPYGATTIHGTTLVRVFDLGLYKSQIEDKDAPRTKADGLLPAPQPIALQRVWNELDLMGMQNAVDDVAVVSIDEVPTEPSWADIHYARNRDGSWSASGYVSDYYKLDGEEDEEIGWNTFRVVRLTGIDQDKAARESDDRLA